MIVVVCALTAFAVISPSIVAWGAAVAVPVALAVGAVSLASRLSRDG